MFDGYEDGPPPWRPEFPMRRWVVFAVAFVVVFAAGLVCAIIRGCR